MNVVAHHRVAALYDIHGNLPALEAALEAVEAARVDAVVIGGDVVLGPMPRETLALVRALGSRARFVRGNCDRLVVDAWDGRLTTRLPAAVGDALRWVAAQLEREERDFLAAFPATVALEIDGLGDVLFCHASPRSDDEIFTARSAEARIAPMLAGVTQRVVICGHTHMPFDRTVGETRLVNAGSIGMPYGATGAHWLLLGPDVAARRTAYDLEAAAERVRATGYPGASEFAARHVLEAPSAEAMLSLLEPDAA